MRKHSLIFILLLTLFITACQKEEVHPPKNTSGELYSDNESSSNGEEMSEYLTISVSGIKSIKGKINIALYNSESTFNDPDKAFKEFFLDFDKKPKTSFKLENIPPGEYAFALFHDENENYELDTNFLGIPQEGFAFSNNAMGNFSPPSYEDAKFTLKPNTYKSFEIELIHY